MDIDNLLKSFDNFFISINQNKVLLILILIIVGLFSIYYVNNNADNFIDLFSNNIFKLVLFVLITYIASSSPAIGLSLAIAMIAVLQVVTYTRIKKETNEKFSHINPADPVYLDFEYLKRPLEKLNELSPSINLDLTLENPDVYYNDMIKKGKVLLDDSVELDKDLEKRYDIREQNIANITKRNGIELVTSGINRLQKSDQGEYNCLNQNSNKFNKFIKYNKLFEGNENNPVLLASFLELKNNFNNLINISYPSNDYIKQMGLVNHSELEFLETVYKYKKDNFLQEKQQEIEKFINEIKKCKNDNNLFREKLIILTNLLN